MPGRARDDKPGKDKPGGALICVGVIAAAHGIKGEVKVKSFTEKAEDIAAYGPLWDEAGARRFDVTVRGPAKDGVIAAVRGVTTRNAAEALRGTRLHVPRTALPEAGAEEFYYADLVGLRAVLGDGTELGSVKAVYDFGAGDVIEIEDAKGRVIDLPFTVETVPGVDVAAGHIVVAPPEGLAKAPVSAGAAKPKSPARARRRLGHKR